MDRHTLLESPNDRPKRGGSRLIGLILLLTVIGCILGTLIVVVQTRNDVNDLSQHLRTSGKDSIISGHHLAASAYATPYVPPRKYQYTRGTCWDFATVALIEHQYRLQGIEKKYLNPEEYLQLSEQAYGNVILKLCQQYNDVCLTPGDKVALNSTSGGEVHLLYEFAKQFENAVLPVSVCPYIKQKDDSSCPNIDNALQNNPLSFTVDAFSSIYDIEHIKAALRQSGHALGFSTPVWSTDHYMPCTDENKDDPRCKAPGACKMCPSHTNYNAKCCVTISSPCYNMEGEFWKNHELLAEGGHAMTLVGYNDQWVHKDGRIGTFIIRNTWEDGVINFGDEFTKETRARGSHSIAYFMNEISEAVERIYCPNSHNPRNWFQCGVEMKDLNKIIEDCHSTVAIHSAEIAVQPLQLQCSDASYGCKKQSGVYYYAINNTHIYDQLYKMCFLEYDENTAVGKTVCYGPYPLDFFSIFIEPIPSQVKKNSDDICGYYAFPYDIAREARAKFGGFWVNDYHFTFSDESYIRGKKADNKDYSLIGSSTGKQETIPKTVSPFPNPHVTD